MRMRFNKHGKVPGISLKEISSSSILIYSNHCWRSPGPYLDLRVNEMKYRNFWYDTIAREAGSDLKVVRV